MTSTHKLIIKAVIIIFMSALLGAFIQSFWELYADNVQLVWGVFSDVNMSQPNTELSQALGFTIIIVIILLIKIFRMLKWLKIKKRLKKNFATIVKNAPNNIGVYIVRLEGNVEYVGRAIENREDQNPSGLRKRLQEHYRGADTGNNIIFMYKDEVNIEVYTTNTVEEAKKLEARLIRKYNTVKNGWNKRYED